MCRAVYRRRHGTIGAMQRVVSIRDSTPFTYSSRKQLRGLLSDARAVRGSARWVLMRRQLVRLLQPRADRLVLPNGLREVLFICHGNIMRSALAAELLRVELRRNALEGVVVRSAGLAAVTNSPADPRARLIAQSFGMSLEDHRATPVSAELAARADLILVMDWRNDAEMVARFPALTPKLAMLGALAPRDFDEWPSISDPYARDASEAALCFHRIRVAVAALASQILAFRSPAAI